MMRVCLPVLAIVAALVGCSLFGGGAPVVVRLPAVPREWEERFGALGFEVFYPDAAGETAAFRLPPGARRTVLPLLKESFAAVVAYPVVDGGERLLPAGGVLGVHLSRSGVLELRWEHGFLAELLLSARGYRRALESCNLPKLARAVVDKSGGDPWSIDREVLARAISLGVVSSHMVARKPAYDLTVSAAEGQWTCWNPLRLGPYAASGGLLELSGLPSGVHVFYRFGSGERMTISVTADGWTLADRVTDSAGYGRW